MVKDNVSVVLPAGDRSPRDNGRDGRTDKISIQAQHVTCPTFFPLFYMRKRNNRLGVNCNCNSKKLPALTDLQMQNTGTASFFFRRRRGIEATAGVVGREEGQDQRGSNKS